MSSVYGQSDSAEGYLEAAKFIQMAEKLESSGQFDDAINFYRQAENIFSEFNDEESIVLCFVGFFGSLQS
ncbi:hypothetical protein HY485_05050 [Candidatus Woesearchaeota archaeon]|nr:hypothetical protein [Candidatus Woesearchaeota archaeon]